MKKNSILLIIILALFVSLLVFFSIQKPKRPLTNLNSSPSADSSVPQQQRVDNTAESTTAVGSIEEVSSEQITITNGLESLTVKISKDIVIHSKDNESIKVTSLKKGMNISALISEVGGAFEVTQINIVD